MRSRADAQHRRSRRSALRIAPAAGACLRLCVALAVCATFGVRVTLARRGPALPPADAAPALTPESLISRVRGVYAGSNCSERVTVSVRVADKPARTSVLWVQTCPTTVPAKVWIKAGELRVWGEGNVLRAASSAPASPFFETELSGSAPVSGPEKEAGSAPTAPLRVDAQMLERVLPALPLPQLDLWSTATQGNAAVEGAPGVSRLTAYASGIRWLSAETDQRSNTSSVRGECRGGTVTMVCDSKSSRLRRVVIELQQPGAITINIEVAAVSLGSSASVPTDPIGGESSGGHGINEGSGGSGGAEAGGKGAGQGTQVAGPAQPRPLFVIDTAARRRVGTMAELALSSIPSVVGSAIDWSSVQTLDGRSARGLIKPVAAAGTEVPGQTGTGAGPESGVRTGGAEDAVRRPRVVLVVREDRGRGGEERGLSAFAASVMRALDDRGAGAGRADDPIGPIWVVLDIAERGTAIDEAFMTRLERSAAEIRACFSRSPVLVLWAAGGEWGERLVPRDVRLAGVVLNDEQTVRAVVVRDADDGDGSAFADELEAAIGPKP